MDFAGKRAVVTGAASGIGKALAAELIARGATVLLADINEGALGEVAAELGGAELGDRAGWTLCDVSDHASVEALAATAQQRMGGVDLVFANAGVITSGRTVRTDPAEVDWILGVNLRGAWSTAAVFVPLMAAQPEGGRLIITGSEHSLGFQHPGAGIYTATKHAVLGLAEVLRAEAPANVGVSLFCPGLVVSALGSGERPEGLPDAGGKAAASWAVQSRGMSAEEAARRALDGVATGSFYIVTHPHALAAAQRRLAELEAAYAAQAPWFEGAEKYNVNSVIAAVVAEAKQG